MCYCFNETHLHIVNLHTNSVYSFVFTLQDICGLFYICYKECRYVAGWLYVSSFRLCVCVCVCVWCVCVYVCVCVCVCVRLSARISVSHWTHFCKISYWGLVCESVEKIEICLQSFKNIGQFKQKT